MKKKFFAFFGATVILFAMLLGIYVKYIRYDSYMVFVESFDHGVITVDSGITRGTDSKYRVECEPGQEITFNINPSVGIVTCIHYRSGFSIICHQKFKFLLKIRFFLD